MYIMQCSRYASFEGNATLDEDLGTLHTAVKLALHPFMRAHNPIVHIVSSLATHLCAHSYDSYLYVGLLVLYLKYVGVSNIHTYTFTTMVYVSVMHCTVM